MSARRESKSLPILEHMSPREVPPLMLGGQNSRPPRRIAALRGVLLLVFAGFIGFRKKKHPFAIRPWNPSSVYIISVYMICAIEYIFYMKSARTGRHHENAQRNQWNYVIGSSPTDETAIYIYMHIICIYICIYVMILAGIWFCLIPWRLAFLQFFALLRGIGSIWFFLCTTFNFCLQVCFQHLLESGKHQCDLEKGTDHGSCHCHPKSRNRNLADRGSLVIHDAASPWCLASSIPGQLLTDFRRTALEIDLTVNSMFFLVQVSHCSYFFHSEKSCRFSTIVLIHRYPSIPGFNIHPYLS